MTQRMPVLFLGHGSPMTMITELVGGPMHPLTLAGLDDAMGELTRKKH